MKKKVAAILVSLLPLVYLVVAVAIVAAAATSGTYPSGTEAMTHIYRGEVIYRSIGQGIWYPYYDPMWFNGTELLRLTPPLTSYLLALCQALARGSATNGYLIFLGVLYYLGALAWSRIGTGMDRPLLGGFLGLIWFFLPNHLYICFVEGNLPKMLAIVLLPWLFYHAVGYLDDQNRRHILPVTVMVLLLFLTHFGFAGMTLLCLVLLMIVCGISRAGKGYQNLILAILAGILLSGVWLAPYLASGILNVDYGAAMAASFQDVVTSLDITQHLSQPGSSIYLGLSLALALLLTGLLAPRKPAAWAWTGLLLMVMSGSVFYTIVKAVYGHQYLRMLWVFPVIGAILFLALLAWRTPRLPILLLICLLLTADCLPTLSLIFGAGRVNTVIEERFEETLDSTLLSEALSMTTHRLAVLDEGNLGYEGVYLATSYETPVPIIGGGGDRTYVPTGRRLEQLSHALTVQGGYLYVFDRCLELGCDTILLQNSLIPEVDRMSQLPEQAARRLGYEAVLTNGPYTVYHADLGSGWGLVSKYSAIGIGTTAYRNSIIWPTMEETTDIVLDHYTFEQLREYDTILLSGFTYEDREAAEELVLALSEDGVRIIIEADGVPETHATHNQSFLNVICNAVEFSNGYPELDTIDGMLSTSLFPRDHSKWDTVYVEGLDEVWGTVVDNDVALPFYGTVHNENIIFVGLNLSYFLYLTQDTAVAQLLSHSMNLSNTELPERRLVPLTTTYGPNRITFQTDADEVNTTIAYHDFFQSDAEITNRNQLLEIDAGTTEIRLEYPCFWPGAAASLLGLIGILRLLWRLRAEEEAARRAAEPEQAEQEKQEEERTEEGERT